MLSKLRSQREAGLFCDITLRTSGRSFLAHRAVLAAVSDHFQEIFTEMDSSMKADIDLTGKSGHLGATSLYLSCFLGKWLKADQNTLPSLILVLTSVTQPPPVSKLQCEYFWSKCLKNCLVQFN